MPRGRKKSTEKPESTPPERETQPTESVLEDESQQDVDSEYTGLEDLNGEGEDDEVKALVALKTLLDSDRKGIESYATSRISSDLNEVVTAFANMINTVETLSTIFGDSFKEKASTFVGRSLTGLSEEFSRRFPSSVLPKPSRSSGSVEQRESRPKEREARSGYVPGSSSGTGGVPVRRSSDGVVMGEAKPKGKEILIGGAKSPSATTINVTASEVGNETSGDDWAICLSDGCEWSGPETSCKRKVSGSIVILSCPECGSKIT